MSWVLSAPLKHYLHLDPRGYSSEIKPIFSHKLTQPLPRSKITGGQAGSDERALMRRHSAPMWEWPDIHPWVKPFLTALFHHPLAASSIKHAPPLSSHHSNIQPCHYEHRAFSADCAQRRRVCSADNCKITRIVLYKIFISCRETLRSRDGREGIAEPALCHWNLPFYLFTHEISSGVWTALHQAIKTDM